jgi:hypothetical protein
MCATIVEVIDVSLGEIGKGTDKIFVRIIFAIFEHVANIKVTKLLETNIIHKTFLLIFETLFLYTNT